MTIVALRRLLAVATGAALLGGCTVGPNYYGPPQSAPMTTAVNRFARAPADAVAPNAPPSRWWLALGDAELTKLINDAFAASPTLQQAQASIRKARGVLRENQTKLLPTGGVNASAVYIKLPDKTTGLVGTAGPLGGALGGAAGGLAATGAATDLKLPKSIDLYSTGFDASWEIDIFGGVRRGIESARAEVQAQQASFEDSQVQLASEVAQNYVNLRDAQQRVLLGQAAVAADRQMLELTIQRRLHGTADDSDVESQRAQLAQDSANVVPTRIQVDQYLDQLALLTGREAGSIDGELTTPAAVPTPPAIVPIGDPAAMLRRRPDVRQAERQLASDNATIGQNVASYFPTVSLFGALSFGSTSLSDLISSKNMSALAVPTMSWSFLNIPQTRAKVRQAEAQRDISLANYRQKVLAALQDANDALANFGHQRESVRQDGVAVAAATRSATINRQRYAKGTATLIDWLNSQRQKNQAEQSLSQALASLTNYYVAMQKSLGLGWQDAPAPDPLPKMPDAAAARATAAP